MKLNAGRISRNKVSLLKMPGNFTGDTVTIPDVRYDYGEDRLITLGTLAGRVVVVVHVTRGEKTRIISMRKANAREKEIYHKRLGQN